MVSLQNVFTNGSIEEWPTALLVSDARPEAAYFGLLCIFLCHKIFPRALHLTFLKKYYNNKVDANQSRVAWGSLHGLPASLVHLLNRGANPQIPTAWLGGWATLIDYLEKMTIMLIWIYAEYGTCSWQSLFERVVLANKFRKRQGRLGKCTCGR